MTKLALVPLLAETGFEVYTKHRLWVGAQRYLLWGLDRPEKGSLLLLSLLLFGLLLLAKSLLPLLVQNSL